jgi:hypothetical protein
MAAVVDVAMHGEVTWDVEALPLEHADDALARVRRRAV